MKKELSVLTLVLLLPSLSYACHFYGTWIDCTPQDHFLEQRYSEITESDWEQITKEDVQLQASLQILNTVPKEKYIYLDFSLVRPDFYQQISFDTIQQEHMHQFQWQSIQEGQLQQVQTNLDFRTTIRHLCWDGVTGIL